MIDVTFQIFIHNNALSFKIIFKLPKIWYLKILQKLLKSKWNNLNFV
jgi:hypothetical protein